MGVVYIPVLEKFGGFGGFVATGLGGFENVRRRRFRQLWRRIRPFLYDTLEYVSESIMLQKTRGARAGGELNKGKFLRCNHTH